MPVHIYVGMSVCMYVRTYVIDDLCMHAGICVGMYCNVMQCNAMQCNVV